MSFSISALMATSTPSKGSEPKPGSLRSTKSFPRHESQETPNTPSRSQRAHTIQNGSTPGIAIHQPKSPQRQEAPSPNPNAFEASEEEAVEPPRASVDLDDIPIELVSMTDKYVPWF